jgi:hypothetical protein
MICLAGPGEKGKGRKEGLKLADESANDHAAHGNTTAENQIGLGGQSGWADSNRRPPRPKRGALASCATPRRG